MKLLEINNEAIKVIESMNKYNSKTSLNIIKRDHSIIEKLVINSKKHKSISKTFIEELEKSKNKLEKKIHEKEMASLEYRLSSLSSWSDKNISKDSKARIFIDKWKRELGIKSYKMAQGKKTRNKKKKQRQKKKTRRK